MTFIWSVVYKLLNTYEQTTVTHESRHTVFAQKTTNVDKPQVKSTTEDAENIYFPIFSSFYVLIQPLFATENKDVFIRGFRKDTQRRCTIRLQQGLLTVDIEVCAAGQYGREAVSLD